MKFSIIITAYNDEKYLSACIDSVLQQTFDDYEIVLIDDGSTDQTASIGHRYASEHPCIKYVYQQNGGPSSARNSGIQHAQGDFMIFLDGDDVWKGDQRLSDMQQLLQQNTDILLFGYATANENLQQETVKTVFPASLQQPKDQLLEYLISSGLFTSSSCLKCIRREWLLEHHILFRQGKYVEDIDWNLRLAVEAENVVVYPQSFYIYRKVNGSRSNTCSRQKLDDYYEAIEEGTELIKNSDREYLYHYLAYQYCILLGMAADQQDLRQKLRQFTWLLNYDAQKKVRLVHQSVRIIGYNNTCRLLKKYLH